MPATTTQTRPAHTPGPWSVGALPIISGKYAGCYGISPVAGPAFAVMIGGGPADLRAANARLIAAAPELLEALKEVTRCLAWHVEYHGTGMDGKAVAEARSVIAKATGDAL